MTSHEVLVFNTAYFKAHMDHWNGISEELSSRAREGEEARAADGALNSTLLPGFKAVHDRVVDQIITNLLSEGSTQTAAMADALEAAARGYLKTEDQNQAESDAILTEAGIS